MTDKDKENEEKPRITDLQKQKIKKYAVFALMGVVCAGCMWLIFAPSVNEKAKKDQMSGFNTDIPLPKEEGLIGDKRDAYEQEQMRQKQSERMRSLDDFSSMIGNESGKPSSDLVLLDNDAGSPTSLSKSEKPSQTAKSVQNSVSTYKDVNRTLGNFYETPKNDVEKEKMRNELDELRTRLNEQERKRNAVDEQMEIMERSYQVASKYMPLNPAAGSDTSFPVVPTSNPEATKNLSVGNSSQSAIVPVGSANPQMVSALRQNTGDAEFMEAYSKPRNMGFLTATAGIESERKNTISTCVHDDQTVMDGENVRLRLLEPMRAGKMLVRENTILSGFAKIQGERLQITVNSLEYNGNIIPVEMTVYDIDGQKGIFIPDTKEVNATKEIAANMGTNAGTSISLSSNAGEQFAADMGRSVIQGVSQFFSRKMREVKVNLKAGYRVFLLPALSYSPKGVELAQVE